MGTRRGSARFGGHRADSGTARRKRQRSYRRQGKAQNPYNPQQGAYNLPFGRSRMAGRRHSVFYFSTFPAGFMLLAYIPLRVAGKLDSGDSFLEYMVEAAARTDKRVGADMVVGAVRLPFGKPPKNIPYFYYSGYTRAAFTAGVLH